MRYNDTMTISKQVGDREFQRFREDSTGKPAVAVVNADGTSIASAARGTTPTVTTIGDSITSGTLIEGIVVTSAGNGGSLQLRAAAAGTTPSITIPAGASMYAIKTS